MVDEGDELGERRLPRLEGGLEGGLVDDPAVLDPQPQGRVAPDDERRLERDLDGYQEGQDPVHSSHGFPLSV